MPQRHDVVVFGATGFTGRLVAEVLTARAAGGRGPTWALAGRSRDKLLAVRQAIGAPDSVPLIEADAADPAAMAALVGQAKVVITTVGPYQRHGEALVTACAQAGTDYVDLCGEPVWMARMIPRLQAPARASGARIVFSCGFDSIPFDLGVVFLQAEAQRRFGAPLDRVRGRVRSLKGGASGGTVASLLATLDETGRDPAAARTMADPFALTPGFQGPAQPDDGGAVYDEQARSWTAPFIMAAINTKNVHRSNALRGHPWGTDFVYDERLLLGDGAAGRAKATLLATATRVQNGLLGFGPSRRLLGRLALPQPGQGPSLRQREAGSFDLLFIGEQAGGRADGAVLRAAVHGDRDPGYGSTSKMIVEAALCLAHDIDLQQTPGGVWTAGAAMGLALVRRLEAHAGLRFTLLDT